MSVLTFNGLHNRFLSDLLLNFSNITTFNIRRRCKLLIFFSAVILIYCNCLTCLPQDSGDQKKAYLILKERGEVFFSFPANIGYSLDFISHLVSVDNLKNDSIYAYSNELQFHAFLETEIPYTVLIPPSLRGIKEREKKSSGENWQDYPSYNEYLSIMDSFVLKYPALCRLAEIGTSVGGKKILAVKVSDHAGLHEDEPGVFLTSTIHGDEGSGFVLMLRLTSYLLSQYHANEHIKYLLDRVELYINPLANPDGLYFTGDNTVAGAKRFNLNNVDLNRNFPDPDEGDHPDGNPWQPETQAMMEFMSEHRFVLSANFHDGAEVVNYPWDTWARRHPDDTWYMDISRHYTDTVHKYSNDDYMRDLNDGITNGYDWYRITGGRQDYVNYFLHSREVTIELSHIKTPFGIALEQLWESNRESFIQYIFNCLYGIGGTIRDSETSEPLKAQVFISNHDQDNSFVYSDPQNGSYYRFIDPGTYTLVATAPDYYSKVLTAEVFPETRKELDIRLDPLSDNLHLYPNPFTGRLYLQLNDTISDLLRLEVFDMSGRLVFERIQENPHPEVIQVDLWNLQNGIYTLRVTGNGSKRNFRIVKIPPP